MTQVLYLFLGGWVVGLALVGSGLSPYFAAISLMAAAGCGCGILAEHGASFLSLVLFLIYLGGMLVVFAYSAALAAEPYPEGLGGRYVLLSVGGYLGGVVLAYGGLCGGLLWSGVEEFGDFYAHQVDLAGIVCVYFSGGGLLILSAWALLVTLLVILELTRGLGRGALRAV
ncbi:NADH dehydrogenase subunit 6 (mitochondrion) [Brachionichthys hirsutus]